MLYLRSLPGGEAARVIFFATLVPGMQQFSTVSFSGFGLWVRVRVLGSDNHKRFPNSNPNLNHNSNRNITLTGAGPSSTRNELLLLRYTT